MSPARPLLALGVLALAIFTPGSSMFAAHDQFAMPGHMKMTQLRPSEAGDKQRAAEILIAARAAAEPYRDYHKAFEDGYSIFHPEIPQQVYHFTDNAHALYNTTHFNPSHPTSLLYVRTKPAHPGDQPGYKLVGVMYTAPFPATPDELNARIPLSIARWHLHTNLCLPPEDEIHDRAALARVNPKFGLRGSITTQEACDAVGGTFISHVFGWMVHVYPFETDPAKVWSSGMDDDHGSEHDLMPGMEM